MNKYFADNETMCPCGCGKNNPDPALLEMLDELRENLSRPLYVNSFCRCSKHNAAVGGVTTSSHLKGLAVDLRTVNAVEAGQIVLDWGRICREYGKPFRVEIGGVYVHLDIDTGKANPCIWRNLKT